MLARGGTSPPVVDRTVPRRPRPRQDRHYQPKLAALAGSRHIPANGPVMRRRILSTQALEKAASGPLQ